MGHHLMCLILLGSMILSWRPVFRYADDTLMTPADQASVRYRVEVGDDRNAMQTAVEDLHDSWIVLDRIGPLKIGQFITVLAYIGSRDGPRATAIRWQGQSTIGPARQSIQAPP